MIKLFRGRIQIHLLMLPVFIVLLLFYSAGEIMGFICATVVHECAHAAMASALGVYVKRIEILPYGCAAVIEKMDYIRAASVFMIAAAGPAANIICCSIASNSLNGVFSQSFLKGCIGLCAVNMLPCAKTDGGRMLAALLSKFYSEDNIGNILKVVSVFIGMGVIGIFIYLLATGEVNITLAVFGIFILISAYDMKRRYERIKYNKLLLRRKILKSGSVYAAHHVIKEDSTVADAISVMEGNKYNIFYIVDNDMKIRCSADESEIIAKAIKEGNSVKLSRI